MEHKAELSKRGAPRLRSQTSFALEIKSLGTDGSFAGYASVFGVVDNQQDVVAPGAFKATLKNRKQPVQLLWQHQWEEPIGTIEALFEDARGLYLRGKLLMEVARAREAHALMKAGVVRGLSIGYNVKRASRDRATGTRTLLEVELWEVSLVTFPANEAAQVTVVKSTHAAQADAFFTALARAEKALLAIGVKYSANQPRVPAGSPEGGQWTDGGGGTSSPAESTPNMAAAIEHLRREAKPKSIKKCAQYVRQALNAGGFKVRPPKSADAKDFGPSLEAVGFRPVARSDKPADYPLSYVPVRGDVVVIQSTSASRPGHMAMYDGTHWISDFRQRGFWPRMTYLDERPSYVIYRYPFL